MSISRLVISIDNGIENHLERNSKKNLGFKTEK